VRYITPTMLPPRLICYGDLCIDILVQAESFPQPGQDATARHVALFPAGSAANCAVTAARLGVPTQFAGVTGKDTLADVLVSDLRQNGVQIDHLRRADAPTAVTIAILRQHGERTFISFRGSNAQPYGPLPPDLIAAGDCLHLSGYSFQDSFSRATALALMQQARVRGALVALDSSFQFARDYGSSPGLADLDFIFPSQEEARLLSGVGDPFQAAVRIRALGPKTVVVKLGDAGCLIVSEGVNAYVPAYPVSHVADTTGAGDAFCGGFLSGILAGWDVQQAARLGHMTAAHVIRALGGHTAAPSLADLIAFAAQHDPALIPALKGLDNRLRSR
jgi:sugar/nucleoside kinase (ribokinase family)